MCLILMLTGISGLGVALMGSGSIVRAHVGEARIHACILSSILPLLNVGWLGGDRLLGVCRSL